MHACVNAYMHACMRSKKVPQEFKDAIIITIYKKDNRADCGNHCEFSLLSIADYVLAKNKV